MGVFKRMITERDEEEMFQAENKRLLDRIAELKARVEEISVMDRQKLMRDEWEYPTDIQNWEINAILPEWFISIEDIRKAIVAAQEKLISLWEEYYGVEEENEMDGQLWLFDFINPIDGTLRAA